MIVSIKRLFVRLFILIVKVSAVLFYYTKRAFRLLSTPFVGVKNFVLRYIGVPIYRSVFSLRRFFARIYVPGKNRFMYLLTNRYAIHGLVVVLIFSMTAMNVQASELRSEDFGQDTMLYRLVTGEESYIVSVTADSVGAEPKHYLVSLLSVGSSVDYINTNPDNISTGSGALVAPTVSDVGESVAPRTEMIIYNVSPGDTISTIASKHGISISTLLWANDLTVKSIIKPGDDLKIMPVDGVTHTVKSGETLTGLAKEFDADKSEILAFNHLEDDVLNIGTELIIPGGKPPTPKQAAPKIANVFKKPSATTTPAYSPSNGVNKTPSGTAMIWPTDLHVITQYFGWRHTGLDIDCHFTNNNYAAADGIVKYSGWKGGYGNVVEIDHGNGMMTRYGHHKSLYVKAGQHVSQGEAIGMCGTTGYSTGTHLHFEVIKNGKFQNPLEYVK